MHRVFVHRGKDAFYFASEAKALLAGLPETREFDPKGLVELMSCGCTLGDQSLFKGIEVLPGGSLVVFASGKLIRRGRYFDRTSWETQNALSDAEFTSHVLDILPKVSKKYASSRTTVGVSLTGGFDSRMVIACLNPEPGSLPCYSFGSMYRDTFDVKVGRQVAGACGQPHHVLTLGKDFVSKLSEYLEKAVFLSDGYLGLSGAAELYANSLAREIAPVRLTGNWGSELLRGVRAFKFAEPAEGILHPDLKEYVEETGDTFERLSKMNKASFAVFQQAPHQSYGRFAIERSQLVPRTPFLDKELVRHMYRAPDTLNGFTLAAAIIGRSRPDLLGIPTDRGFLGNGGALSKACRRVYRQALFKAEYWVGPGAPDWLGSLNGKLFAPLEKNILGRHKFYHLRQWIRDFLSEQVRDILKCEAKLTLSPYLNQKRLEEHMNKHLQGSKNYTNEMDAILTLALVGRIHFRSGGRGC
jgi:asparagine synthase (glutamine-hydrolysing)